MVGQVAALIGILAATAPTRDRGRELVQDVCTYCHNLERLQGKELNREEWRGLITGMIYEGAPVTDEEFSAILDYLVKHYGRKH
jgi:hypothetical protein